MLSALEYYYLNREDTINKIIEELINIKNENYDPNLILSIILKKYDIDYLEYHEKIKIQKAIDNYLY